MYKRPKPLLALFIKQQVCITLPHDSCCIKVNTSNENNIMLYTVYKVVYIVGGMMPRVRSCQTKWRYNTKT